MSDLDARARAIVEAGRTGDVPSAADRDRIKRAVLLQIAASGAVASSAAAGGLSGAAKAGVAVLAMSLAGGGALAVWKAQHPPSTTPHVRPALRAAKAPAPAASAVQRATDEASAPTISSPDELAHKAVRSRRVVAPERAEVVAAPDPLAAEVEVLKSAREELRLGRPARALEALVEYDRRFGSGGALGEERQAMAAIAGCQAKPGPAARAQAQAFLRRAPASPLRERVSEACITPAIPP